LKNENGARFATPDTPIVATQAIGRGATSPFISPLSIGRSSVAGSRIM
jgi:hypothetical protein